MSHWVVSEIDSFTLSKEQILKENLEFLFFDVLDSRNTSILSIKLVSVAHNFSRVVASVLLA